MGTIDSLDEGVKFTYAKFTQALILGGESTCFAPAAKRSMRLLASQPTEFSGLIPWIATG